MVFAELGRGNGKTTNRKRVTTILGNGADKALGQFNGNRLLPAAGMTKPKREIKT